MTRLALPILSCIVLAAALLFGGGARRDVPSDYVPEFLAILLIVLAAPEGLRRLRAEPIAAWVLAGIVGVAILHIIPLPPSLWGQLPGREVARASYAVADMTPPWLPISLQPAQALKSAFALLPAVALFLASLSLPTVWRRELVSVALLVGLISVPLGIVQVMGGGASSYYFYAITNEGQAVGFFANRNHFAAFLYGLVPLAAALLSERKQAQGLPYWATLSFVWFACLIGLATTGSRSALLLGAISIAASFIWIVHPAFPEYFKGRRARLGLIAVSVLVIAVAGAMGGAHILGRFDKAALDDARGPLLFASLELAWRYFPVGSGLGSFERIYEMQAPAQALFTSVANHVHNDWGEIFVETGPLGLLVAAGFLFFLVRKTHAALRHGQGLDDRLGWAAIILLWLLCIHSLWDYPLRTIALSSLFALACAFQFDAPERIAPNPRRLRRRRRTQRMDARRPAASKSSVAANSIELT